MRRILIIAAVVVSLGGVGGGVYFFFFANQAGVAVTPQENTGTLPEAGTVTLPAKSEETPQTVEVTQPTKVAQRLIQISKGPVVPGAIAYTASSTTATSETIINFIERTSGNVYQYLVHTGTLSRTSNKTIPGIQEAYWLPTGALAYVRYLSVQAGDTQSIINTYALPVSGEGGYFLPQNITSFAASATNILMLASGTNGSVGTLAKPDGGSTKQAFMTPLGAIRAHFAGAGQYVMYTKPSSTLAGFAYLVNSTGNFERIAGPLNGLAALASPSGKWVLLTYTTSGILKSALYEVATHETIALPVGTIADKCVWAKDAAVYCGVPKDPPSTLTYPDDWYQGAVAFSDRIWRIDVAGRFAELTLDFTKEATQNLDTTALTLDPKETILVFRNKNDASLWSFEL